MEKTISFKSLEEMIFNVGSKNKIITVYKTGNDFILTLLIDRFKWSEIQRDSWSLSLLGNFTGSYRMLYNFDDKKKRFTQENSSITLLMDSKKGQKKFLDCLSSIVGENVNQIFRGATYYIEAGTVTSVFKNLC